MRNAANRVLCPSCGVLFAVKPSELRKRAYCSKKCMAVAYRTRLKSSGNPNFTNAGEKRCEHCGDLFVSYAKRRFCSFSCHIQSGAAQRNAIVNGKKNSRGGRLDGNHHQIVAVLRAVGAAVMSLADLGNGCPDLLVSYRRRLFLLEVKNPQTAYGKKGLNVLQIRWAEEWRGSPVAVVRTPEQALQAIGAVRRNQ